VGKELILVIIQFDIQNEMMVATKIYSFFRPLTSDKDHVNHPSLLGLAVLIAFVAVLWNHQELIEELLVVFIVLYSLRLALAEAVREGKVLPLRR
jgi:hypothetical protein